MFTKPLVDVAEVWHIAIATDAIEPKLDRYQRDLGIGPWVLLEFDFPPGSVIVDGAPVEMSVRAAATQFGFLQFGFDQPMSKPNPFQEMIDARGSGPHHLACLVADADLARERLRARGFRELLRSDAVGPRHDSKVSYFDLRETLGTILEVSQIVGQLEMSTFYGDGRPPAGSRVAARGASHVAIVVRDLDRTVKNYADVLGFGPAELGRVEGEVKYCGAPARLSARTATIRAGSFVLQLIEPQTAGNPWHDFLSRHGQGITNVGVLVDDVAAAAAELRALGYPEKLTASGAAGDRAYFDTESALGIAIELRPAA
jgi:catechol 2,3-dioxygenase-like lactoylglutathione lyase family enzyme